MKNKDESPDDKSHSPTPLAQTNGKTQNGASKTSYAVTGTAADLLQHIPQQKSGMKSWLQRLLKGRAETDIREALEEYIEEAEKNAFEDKFSSISIHERALLANILKLKDLSVVDIMIPRADIVAISVDSSQEELLTLLAEKQNSRIAVYKETLDDIVGTIHIKDILSTLAKGKEVNISELIRDVPIVSPSMPVLDLLLMFRQIRKHMALVVDEYGGIDGLITIGDVIEAIVGEIDDEYDEAEHPGLRENQDGSLYADSRVNINDFEDAYGRFLSEDEKEDVDTLGGLVFSIAGRIPARGEIITHPSGMVFEILEAGPRRVNKLLIRNIPPPLQDNNG